MTTVHDNAKLKAARIADAKISLAEKKAKSPNPALTPLEASIVIGIEEKTVLNKMFGPNKQISYFKTPTNRVFIYLKDAEAYLRARTVMRIAGPVVVKRIA